MTNPAQLKYLDAMEIPVWVSRDLVRSLEQDIGEAATLNKVVPVSAAFQAEASHEHVGSLLHDLDAQTQTRAKHRSYDKVVEAVVPAKQTTSTPPATSNKINKQITEIGQTAVHTIYACGNLNADWMVIGESPDISTNGQEQPYAGDSGMLLSNMLQAAGIPQPRTQAYLVNILKSSMQNKADVSGEGGEEAEENTQLNHLLIEKIQQVKPKVLLVVGQIAAQNLLNSNEPLVRLRGREHTLPDTKIPLIVTYYPSYLLSKPIDKRKAWEDLKLAILAAQRPA